MKKLGFGGMRLPLLDKTDERSIDFELLTKMVDCFMERGFTYFDTAWFYCGGASEPAFKKVLTSRYPRDSYTIATKLHCNYFDSLEGRDEVLRKQMENCGVEYFDYYLLHDVRRKTLDKYEQFKCFEWLVEKKEQGLVKNIGFSFHDTPDVLEEILTKYPFVDFVQLQLNYIDWEDDRICSGGCYEVAEKHGKPVVVMEPVKGGTLVSIPEEAESILRSMDAEASNPSWAIRFVASLDNVMVVLSGMSNLEQVIDNTNTLAELKVLTEEEHNNVLKAAEIIRNKVEIGCTGCSYCTEGCPMNINIPKLFTIYNKYHVINWIMDRYRAAVKDAGKPSDCIGCGQCESTCPQHLPIIELLKKVSDKFEK